MDLTLMGSLAVYYLSQSLSQMASHDKWLAPAERDRAAAFPFPKRRNDWLLGRWTAKEAVRSYLSLTGSGIPEHASLEIRSAADGAPETFLADDPVPVALALSHCRDRGFCAVAQAGVALGCDIETIEPRDASFIEDYFTDAERDLIAHAPAEDQPLLATLLWSAKESALKCLREGLRRDTRSVVVRLPGTRKPGWNSLIALCQVSSRTFYGWYRCAAPGVQTILATSPVQVPSSLRAWL